VEKNEKKSVFRAITICSVIFSSVFSMIVAISSTYSPYVIMSESMEPVLHVGDVVFVKHDYDYGVVKVGLDGDILVIENYSIFVDNGVPASFYAHLDGKTPIIHRAIEKRMVDEKVYFVTKGDNNPYADGCIKYINWTSTSYSIIEVNSSDPVLIPLECIVGTVVSVVPFIGNFKIHAGTISVHLLVAFGIFFILSLKKRGIIHAPKKYFVHLSPDNPRDPSWS
jgi:signal peptidase I